MENTAAISTIAKMESEKTYPPTIVTRLRIMNAPNAGTLKPLSCNFPSPKPATAATRPAKLTSPI